MRILAPLLRYDYGNAQRGDSLEKTLVVPTMQIYCDVIPFWLEEHGFPTDLSRLQVEILKKAQEVDPDFVFFILMKSEVTIATIRQLGQRWKTVNWFVDDLWRFESFSRRVASAFTHCITIDKFSLPKYHKIGCQRIVETQWGSAYEELDGSPATFEYEVSFVGSWTSVRAWYVQVLERAGVMVHCFGSGWEGGRVGFQEMKEISMKSKISLNLSNSQPDDVSYVLHMVRQLLRALIGLGSRKAGYVRSLLNALKAVSGYLRSEKRVETIKARNFEIPAWGGFQLSYFCLGIEEYFVPGKEIMLFSSPWELVKLTQYYLENETEREAIRMGGNRRAAEHTYEKRFEKLTNWLKNEAR